MAVYCQGCFAPISPLLNGALSTHSKSWLRLAVRWSRDRETVLGGREKGRHDWLLKSLTLGFTDWLKTLVKSREISMLRWNSERRWGVGLMILRDVYQEDEFFFVIVVCWSIKAYRFGNTRLRNNVWEHHLKWIEKLILSVHTDEWIQLSV